MAPCTHFFPFGDASTRRLYCGRFEEHDGWTALPFAVSCPECTALIAAALIEERRTESEANGCQPAAEHGPALGSPHGRGPTG